MNRLRSTWMGFGAVVLASLVVGASIGVVAASRRGWQRTEAMLTSEVAQTLDHHINALALLRMGQSELAVERLETMVDAATVSLAGHLEDDGARQALGVAKLYRRVYAPAGGQAMLVASVLRAAPPPDYTKCKPPILQLLAIQPEARRGEDDQDDQKPDPESP